VGISPAAWVNFAGMVCLLLFVAVRVSMFDRIDTYPDSSRYLGDQGIVAQLLDLGQHQGSYLPVLLFELGGSPEAVFRLNTAVWFICGLMSVITLLLCCGRATTFVIAGWWTSLVWISPLLASWNSSVLVEAVALSICGLAIVVSTAGAVLPRPPRSLWVVLSLALLLVTKPSWTALVAPIALVAVLRGGDLRRLLATAVLALALIGVSMSVTAQAFEYRDGLTYRGWYAFTRTLAMRSDATVEKLALGPGSGCPDLVNVIASTVPGYDYGPPDGFQQALASCPQAVRFFDDDGASLGRLMLDDPVGLAHYAAAQLLQLQSLVPYPTDFRGVSDIDSLGTNVVFSGLWRHGVLVFSAIVLALALIFGDRKQQAFSVVLALTALIGAMALGSIDGIEHSRHLLPVALLSFLSFGIVGASLAERLADRLRQDSPVTARR